MSVNNEIFEKIRSLAKERGISLFQAAKLCPEMAGIMNGNQKPKQPPTHKAQTGDSARSECLELPNGDKRNDSKQRTQCPEPHESPVCHVARESLSVLVSESPCVSVSPVSEGQRLDKELEKELKGLAARNACACAGDTAERKRFKLARDVKGVEKAIGRELTTAELRRTCDEWERASLPFLDWGDDDHFAMLLAELTKVRVPTGEGDTINKALQNVSKLSDSDLPVIPDYADAPKTWRKLAALHREMLRLCGSNIYFLSYRDAAKACNDLSHQSAHAITLALARARVIEIVRKGKAGRDSRKAAEFRYLLRAN
jgi:hypothetical protein